MFNFSKKVFLFLYALLMPVAFSLSLHGGDTFAVGFFKLLVYAAMAFLLFVASGNANGRLVLTAFSCFFIAICAEFARAVADKKYARVHFALIDMAGIIIGLAVGIFLVRLMYRRLRNDGK